jgi:hypothetical protein
LLLIAGNMSDPTAPDSADSIIIGLLQPHSNDERMNRGFAIDSFCGTRLWFGQNKLLRELENDPAYLLCRWASPLASIARLFGASWLYRVPHACGVFKFEL